MRSFNRLVLIAAFAAAGCSDTTIRGPLKRNQGRVVVVNAADEAIVAGDVQICGERFALNGLDPGGSRTFLLSPLCAPGQYQTAVTFKSGATLSRTVGYADQGFNFDDELTLTRDNIVVGPAARDARTQ